MTRKVHRLEVRPFRGLQDGEVVLWEGHGGLRFKGLFAGWGGEVVVTGRRVIFKAATWEFPRQEIRSMEVEPPPGWFTRHVVGGLAWLIDSILFWVEGGPEEVAHLRGYQPPRRPAAICRLRQPGASP